MFLAAGTSFVEDIFSRDQGQGLWAGDGFKRIPAHYIYHAVSDLTGGRAQVVMQAMESSYKYRRSSAHSPTTQLLLHGPVPGGLGTPSLRHNIISRLLSLFIFSLLSPHLLQFSFNISYKYHWIYTWKVRSIALYIMLQTRKIFGYRSHSASLFTQLNVL